MMIIFYVIFFALFLCVCMLIRNEWVCKVMIRMADEDFNKYKRLPYYDYILYRFWAWDINKFVKED